LAGLLFGLVEKPRRPISSLFMAVPEEELPDINKIRALAKVSLPAHMVIGDTHISYVSDPPGAPNDFEIVIEYENHIDDHLKGSWSDIETVQDWSHALTQDIRISENWSAQDIRISFIERTPFTRGVDR
jgi:hypothetical protein